jgi:hypothetical protein
LLDDYDADPVAALTRALAIVHDKHDHDKHDHDKHDHDKHDHDSTAVGGGDAFDALVRRSGLDAETTSALLARDIRALDHLARSLNEQRGLA